MSDSGNIFGGYVEKRWRSNDGGISDPNSFIFSLINEDETPFKAVCTTGNAIYCNPSFGPIFGFGSATDILIYSNSNIELNSGTFFGHNYPHPDYPVGSEDAKCILAGSEFFNTVEIEVFAITN